MRYWATRGGPGVDTMFDAAQMKVGRRLAIKLLNASKFILSPLDEGSEPHGPITAAVDRAMLGNLASLVREATQALDDYEYGRAIELIEREFWGFCDDYLEFVKGRRYGEQGPEGSRVGQQRAGCGVVCVPAIVRAVPSVCDRRSLVVVEGRVCAPCAVADGAMS